MEEKLGRSYLYLQIILTLSIVNMNEDDIQAFIEMTDIDPRNNKAMFGGSGP